MPNKVHSLWCFLVCHLPTIWIAHHTFCCSNRVQLRKHMVFLRKAAALELYM